MSLIAFALATVLAAAVSTQDENAARNCRDDNGVDRCLADVQAEVRLRLGVASIEQEAAAGVEVYRAFFVDGYGNDMPSVSFERRPGEDPKVVVYGLDNRRMSAAVSAAVWREVQAESLFADRVLQADVGALAAEGQTRPPALCLHSWVQTVEMANTWPERWSVVPVRRRTEDACGGGLTTRFAFHLAELAVKAVPPCDALDERQQRNRITQLASCLNLKGDRLAAAELRNARLSFGPRPGAAQDDAYAWQAALGTNGSPRLVWAGEEIRTERGSGDKNVAQFLIAKHAELPRLAFRQESFEGIDARRAQAEGTASYVLDDTTWRASYRQTWVWDPSLFEWMLSDWVVEAFTPAAVSH